MDPFCYKYVPRLSLLSCLVCSLQPCDHLVGKGCPLFVLFPCVFVAFPYGVLGKVWYLIVSIPDLSLLYLHLDRV